MIGSTALRETGHILLGLVLHTARSHRGNGVLVSPTAFSATSAFSPSVPEVIMLTSALSSLVPRLTPCTVYNSGDRTLVLSQIVDG